MFTLKDYQVVKTLAGGQGILGCSFPLRSARVAGIPPSRTNRIPALCRRGFFLSFRRIYGTPSGPNKIMMLRGKTRTFAVLFSKTLNYECFPHNRRQEQWGHYR
jgi:hypothetical protein